MCILATLTAAAYDFEAGGLYFNILSEENNDVEVTYKGYYSHSNPYGEAEIIIPASIEFENQTYRVVGVGDAAFYGAKNLVSVTLPNSVTVIGTNSFYGCSSLESITLPNSVYEIGRQTFYGCKNLSMVILPSSLKEIPSQLFAGCASLKEINLPASIRIIGWGAFDGCAIESIDLPEGIEEADFTYDNSKILSCHAAFNRPTFIDCTVGTCNITLAGVKPSKFTFSTNHGATVELHKTSVGYAGKLIDYDWEWGYNDSRYGGSVKGQMEFPNGKIFPILNKKVETKQDAIYRSLKFEAKSPTTIECTAGLIYREEENEPKIKSCMFKVGIRKWLGGDKYEYETIEAEGVYRANSDCVYDAVLEIPYGVTVTSMFSTVDVEKFRYGFQKQHSIDQFRMPNIEWGESEAVATSTTSARLACHTNLVNVPSAGFEWVRYDAPAALKPSKAPCPVVNGVLTGSLRNLKDDVYYKCRPYYTAWDGKDYVGEWFIVFTGDAGVYFEPEVYTYAPSVRQADGIVTLTGYALAGSDDIIAQGFEYRPVSMTRAADDWKSVAAPGIMMNATLTGLNGNTEYLCRAFVETAKGRFYGAEEKFTTPMSADIDDLSSDYDNVSVTASNGHIVISNLAGDALAKVYNMQGALVAETAERVIDSLSPDLYIVSVGGKTFKVMLK